MICNLNMSWWPMTAFGSAVIGQIDVSAHEYIPQQPNFSSHNAALEDVRSRHHHRRRAHHNVNGRSAGASTSDEKASPVVTSMKAYHHHEETDSTPVSSDVEHSQTPSPRRSCQRKRKERRDSIGEGQDKKFSKSSSDVFPTTCVIEDNEVTDGMRRVQSTVAGLLANNNQDDCCLHQKCNLPVDDHSSTKEKCTFYVSDEEAALEKTSARAVIRPRRSRKVRTDSLKENQVTPEEASIFPWKKNVPSPPPSLSTPPPDVVTTTSSAVFSLVTSVKSSNVQEYDDSSSSSTSDETIVDTEEDISFSAAVKKNSSPVQDSSQNMMNYQPAVAWEPYGTIWKDDQSTRHFGMLHSKQHLDRNHWPRNPNDSTDQETKNKIKQLSKQLSLVRKKIEEFEVKFEEAHGYRPSQAEKQSNKEIRKLILHQNRVKRQIRLFRESGDSGINLDSSSPSMSPVRSWSPACSDFSNLLNVYSDHSDDSLDKFKDSVKDIEDKLDQDRQSSGRPDSLEAMSPAQVLDEKNSIQVALNQVQQVLSKSPNDNEGRTLLKDLLVRYRSVKRLVRRSTNVLIKDPSELETIPEGSEIQLTLASPQHRINIEMNSKMMDSNGNASEFIEPLVGGAVEMDEQQVNALHDMSRSQLLNVQKVAKEEKKQLRRWLKEREFKFQETNGRAMPKDEVKAHDIYNKYKMTKAKLKLVDALLSKQKNSP